MTSLTACNVITAAAYTTAYNLMTGVRRVTSDVLVTLYTNTKCKSNQFNKHKITITWNFEISTIMWSQKNVTWLYRTWFDKRKLYPLVITDDMCCEELFLDARASKIGQDWNSYKRCAFVKKRKWSPDIIRRDVRSSRDWTGSKIDHIKLFYS